MQIGSLVRYCKPGLLGGPLTGLVGLVVAYDADGDGFGNEMVQVLFNGFTLLRWIHEQDCEAIQ